VSRILGTVVTRTPTAFPKIGQGWRVFTPPLSWGYPPPSTPTGLPIGGHFLGNPVGVDDRVRTPVPRGGMNTRHPWAILGNAVGVKKIPCTQFFVFRFRLFSALHRTRENEILPASPICRIGDGDTNFVQSGKRESDIFTFPVLRLEGEEIGFSSLILHAILVWFFNFQSP